MNLSRFARYYFLATAILILAGLVIELLVSAGRDGSYFDTPTARMLNFFTYFTVISNIIVGLTSFMLAAKQNISSNFFWGFRLSGVIAIVVTFLVQRFIIEGKAPMLWPFVGDFILHTAAPIVAFLGWVLFGPRGFITGTTIKVAIIFPVLWIVFVFIRGAITNWYPYDFLDAHEHGYAQALMYVAAITIGFLVLAGIAKVFDSLATRLMKK